VNPRKYNERRPRTRARERKRNRQRGHFALRRLDPDEGSKNLLKRSTMRRRRSNNGGETSPRSKSWEPDGKTGGDLRRELRGYLFFDTLRTPRTKEKVQKDLRKGGNETYPQERGVIHHERLPL